MVSDGAGVQRVLRPRRGSLRPVSTRGAQRQALERLLDERDLLVRRMLRDVRERHPLEAAPGGMDGEDRVQADLAREMDARLLEKEATSRQLLEDALRRTDRGNDGSCTRCGDPIGEARLRAVPFTDLCRACKDREEQETRSAGSPRSVSITS
jgi:DnaK suppressor protein